MVSVVEVLSQLLMRLLGFAIISLCTHHLNHVRPMLTALN